MDIQLLHDYVLNYRITVLFHAAGIGPLLSILSILLIPTRLSRKLHGTFYMKMYWR